MIEIKDKFCSVKGREVKVLPIYHQFVLVAPYFAWNDSGLSNTINLVDNSSLTLFQVESSGHTQTFQSMIVVAVVGPKLEGHPTRMRSLTHEIVGVVIHRS